MRFILSLLFPFSLLFSQHQFNPEGKFDPTIPSPRSALKYEIGEHFSEYAKVERYLNTLAKSSDKIRLVEYGESYEGRKLHLLIISSKDNLDKMDLIRQKNLRLTDPRLFKAKEEAQKIIESIPAIIWLSYSVHGNESSSTEAALITAYQLVAGVDERTNNILKNSIVIIDPLVNPDGRERYVQWFNSTVGRNVNTNPDAIEHNEPWPGGRTNHYYFDLNRDWAWSIQKETQARLEMYRQWMPHVHVDYHEMSYTSTYFFFPAAAPVHTEFPPEVKKWGTIFGKGNAAIFDQHGIPYYTGELFDLFYPGYGDSWPTLNGAIGMTYEQAGHSRAGLSIQRPDGIKLTLSERVRNHYLTSIATLETAVSNRTERLKDFYKFWEEGMIPKGQIRGFVIPAGKDHNKTAQLINMLLRQNIEVHKLESDVYISATKFFERKARSEQFSKGTYFISLDQPKSRLARVLLEHQTAVPDTFFYDVSAWSLPFAAGIDAYTTDIPLPKTAMRIETFEQHEGTVINGKAGYAYIIPWESNNAVKLVWKLLKNNYRLNYANRSFEIGKQYFSAGSIICFVSQNPESIHQTMVDIAKEYGIDVFATNSGSSDKGINLGSNYVRPIKKPEIAILTDSPVNSYDYGELWYMFDWEYDIPFTAIRARELVSKNLSKYDVIILPDSRNYQTVFDSSSIAKTKQWIDNGGILIGIEGGAAFLTKKQSGITAAQLDSDRKEEEKTSEEKEAEKTQKEFLKRAAAFEKEENDRLYRIPGTIFKVTLDTTHPIGYGYSSDIHVLRKNSPSFLLTETGHNVARYSKDSVSVSGYVRKDRLKKVFDSAYLQDYKIGKGRVVLFSENFTFRRFWTGLEKLLMNSILFLPPLE